ncbi:M15 family metallopeptidase domain-containing protein [Streptomyces antimycoticus]|uniref:hypothetical protein n=1 Tax=Streptomyces antimycoticus TaxID=68175 RepID=UPI0036B82DAF
MTEIVLMSDPKVAAVPVRECGERLVDVRRDSRLLVDERKWQDSARAFAHLREGALDRLHKAQAQLPPGMRLLFVEGYRPPSQDRSHRDILGTALTAAGLVNYPTEWWHWSYGARYWALQTGAAVARYGPMVLD